MSADERREAVLEAALTEFAARGLEGTSTEDVARRADISQPYLFRLFPTKKALFLTLAQRCFQRVEQVFEAAAEGLTGEEAIEAMGNAYYELLADRTLLRLQLHCYAACGDPEIRAVVQAGFKNLWMNVERITGAPYERVIEFFAMGMLLNVAAAMELSEVGERWTEWCQY
jgi:AcrR family transcriptional regulator